MNYRNKRAVTITEVLIASVIFIMVAGLALGLMTNTTNDFVKGEDTMTSVQDAAAIIMRLRHDMATLALAPTDGSSDPADFIYCRNSDGAKVQAAVHLDTTSATVSINGDTEECDANKTVFSFYRFADTSGLAKKVTYSYAKNESSIVRQAQGEKTKSYAVPRLKDFQINLYCQEKSAAAVAFTTASTIDCFTGDEVTGKTINRLWLGVKVTVQSDESVLRRRTTRIDIQSHIFPRPLNRKLNGLWTRKK